MIEGRYAGNAAWEGAAFGSTEDVIESVEVGASGLLSDSDELSLVEELARIREDCVRMPLKMEATDGVLETADVKDAEPEPESVTESLVAEPEEDLPVPLTETEDGKLIMAELV